MGYFNLLVGLFLRSHDPQTPVAVGTSETGTGDEKGMWGKVLGFQPFLCHVVTLSVGWALMAFSALQLSQDGVWLLGENLVSTGLHIPGNPCRDVSRAGLRG